MKPTKERKLSKSVINKVKKDMNCRNRIAYEMKINPITVGRWLTQNSIKLTSVQAMEIISQETGISRTKLIA